MGGRGVIEVGSQVFRGLLSDVGALGVGVGSIIREVTSE